MKKKALWVSLIIILLVILSVLYKYYSGNKNNGYYWRTSVIERGDVSLLVTATGLVSADTTVAIGTQVSGILSKLFVDFNSVVKKGQIIAQIDTTILHATKEDAEAVFERAQAQLDEYSREFARQKSLLASQSISQAEYDLALTNYETGRSTVKSMKAQLERAIINLHYATIRSPISGVVISKNMDEGQTVIASFNSPTLFTIVNNLKKMQVQANVSEADIGQVKIGQEVDFSVDAYPDEVFTGYVKQIRLQPVIIQNVVNYIVIISTSNPELKLLPGLTANINIKIERQSNVLKVPANALSFTPPNEYLENAKLFPDSIKKKWVQIIEFNSQKVLAKEKQICYVWVKKGEDIYPIEIIKKLSDGIYTAVVGNIKEGMEVVTGINHSEASTGNSSQNPFMPKFPTRNKKK